MNKSYAKKHRNSQKRIIFEDAVYFVTSKTFNNFPYFREKIFCDLFVENLKLCKKLKRFQLYGWVLIYDHFHLQVQPGDKFDISKIKQFLKRHVSRNINIITGYTANTTPEGDIGQCRLQVDERVLVRQFDQYVQQLKTQFRQKYPSDNPYPKFQFQRSFRDHYTRNENNFMEHLEYIDHNPAKHGLPDDWEYVSMNPKYENLIDEF